MKNKGLPGILSCTINGTTKINLDPIELKPFKYVLTEIKGNYYFFKNEFETIQINVLNISDVENLKIGDEVIID